MRALRALLKNALPPKIVAKGSELETQLRACLAILRKRAPSRRSNDLNCSIEESGVISHCLKALDALPNMDVYNAFAEHGYYCVRYPSVLSLFLTTNCNLRCFICRREGFVGQNMDFENIYKLGNPIRFAKTIDLTGWGEPLIYPKFEDVLNYIYSLNTGEVIQFTTNGTRLSERHAKLLDGHLKSMVISLNAAKASTYNRDMVHGDFKRTIAAVRSFISALKEKDRNKLILYFVAHTENFREIPDFVSLAKELMVGAVTFGNYLVNMKDHAQYTLLNVRKEWNEMVDRAVERGERLGVRVSARRFFQEKERPRESCMSPFDEVFILPDGDVGPCCFSGNHYLGNAFTSSFEEVWFGREYRKLREERYLPACRTCTPFMPFDSICTHFTGDFRVSSEFKAVEELFNAGF